MRHVILLAAVAALCSLLLCATGGVLRLATAQVPVRCLCTDVNFGAWTSPGNCAGQTCLAANLVIDSLACDEGNNQIGCPVTGSVTVAYDACTSVVCVKERHINPVNWPTQCTICPQSGSRLVDDGDTDGPTLNACCVENCDYYFQVWFYTPTQATACPGPQLVGSAHCLYEHHFSCRGV